MDYDNILIYAIVPAYIYQTKKLTSGAKLIAERITALCSQKGYAWITNKSLANIYGIREDTVSKHIKSLESFGFIRCVYSKSEMKSKRTIYLTDNIWVKYKDSSRIKNEKELGHMSEHNINKNNKIIDYDTDGVMLWNGVRCESKPCSKSEHDELNSLLAEFKGDSDV